MTTNTRNHPKAGIPAVGRLAALIPLLLAFSAGESMAAGAAVPSVTAKAALKKGVLTYSGKIKNIAAGTRVYLYDAATGALVHSKETNSKGAFKYAVPFETAPCKLRLEAGSANAVITVGGADKTCKTVPVCYIDTPDKDQAIVVNDSVTFTANPLKGKAATSTLISWNFGDGATGSTASASHKFTKQGSYRVVMTAQTASGTCTDDRVVSVAAEANAVNSADVDEQSVPEVASAMPQANGSNDLNAYTVLPFEETGMQGGSQISLPYNAMINYNVMNAQVLHKESHKPKLNGGDIDVFFSAGSNEKDPVGTQTHKSINSTSQNIFSDGSTGGNVNLLSSTVDPATGLPTKNVFPEGHDFINAKVRKSEQWDRIHQPTAVLKSIDETGTAFADRQYGVSATLPMAKPDEGVRGAMDKGANMRVMPGKDAPYDAADPKSNQPQKMDIGAYPADSANNIKAFQPNTFMAQNVPISDVDDQGRVNPYPLLRIEAKNSSGEVVAKADAVYTTASETRCRECHLPGGLAANEDVWRTPVTESELLDENGNPGPATGAGSFSPGTGSFYSPAISDAEAAKKPWPPAIHNKFDDKIFTNPNFTNLDPVAKAALTFDANGLRTDRVKASRWHNKKTGQSTDPNATRPVMDPNDATYGDWQLQVQLNFRDPSFYGDAKDWVAQEKAALFNTLVMHDYMVYYGPTPAAGSQWPASYSTQVADSYADDVGKSRVQPMYFCSGHHQSQLKFDVGITGKAYPTNRSDYSRAFHAFHGKMQVYKEHVNEGSADSADGLAHNKGELIRDERGHPKMFGGRGWDSQQDDDNGVPFSPWKATDAASITFNSKSFPNLALATPPDTTTLAKPTVQTYTDPSKNNWRPDLFPRHPKGESMLPFGEHVAMEDNCVKCHTGATEKSYRDVHHAAGLSCEQCHGDMLAVGNVYGNEDYNANLTGGGAYGVDDPNKIDPTDFRRPWLDEPNCGSCHVGDGNVKKDGDTANEMAYEHVFSAGVLKHAWMHEDITRRTMDPMNARFAVMPALEARPEKSGTGFVQNQLSTVLFRKSPDVHGSGKNGDLTCGTCHGGSHAIWPNPNPDANDNQTSKQLQGYAGNIVECSVCHIKDDFKDGLVGTDGIDPDHPDNAPLGVAQGYRFNSATDLISPVDAKAAGKKLLLAGPHGMHPVNDQSWWKDAVAAGASNKNPTLPGLNGGWHNDMAGMKGVDDEDQCAACHGNDHKGTRLSRALTDRDFVSSKGKAIHVVKDQVIGCDLCHALAISFSNSPSPKAKDHGWKPAKMHMPPMPMEPMPGGSTGGGGHG